MPDLATEITLQPVRRYGVDAAILFSDIMTSLDGIGFGVTIEPGVGPVVAEPFRSKDDLERIRPLEPDVDVPHVLETVDNLVAELPVPLIGFAGAPFTVASYLVEGRPSRTYGATKRLMHTDEVLWQALMDRLADLAIATLRAQVEHGASAVQLFDSWAGALSPADYERFVLPASRKVLEGVADLGVPRIHFGVNTGELLGLMASAGADVVGVDWRTPLDAARGRVPDGTALQGNLDPAICLAGRDATRDATPRRPGAQRWASRPRVQPRPRRPARDRSRRPRPGGRPGPPRGTGGDEPDRGRDEPHGGSDMTVGVVMMAYGTPASKPRGARLLHPHPPRPGAQRRAAGGPDPALRGDRGTVAAGGADP